MDRIKMSYIRDLVKRREPLWGTWVVEEALGSGTFGAVYELSRQMPLDIDKHGALKVIELNKPLDRWVLRGATTRKQALDVLAEDLKNKAGEIRLMMEVSHHPNVVRYYDYDYFDERSDDEVSGYLLIRMDLMERNLDRIIWDRRDSGGRLSEEETLRYGMDLLEALSHVHKQNILHRDIKPENIFVHKHRIFLGDFGVSKKCGESMGAETVAGTHKYMAPEVYRNYWDTCRYDHRADLYSLGLVLYEMVEGNLPYFTGKLSIEELQELRRADKEIEFKSKVSAGFQLVIRKSLRADPKERFGSAREMKEALEKTVDAGTIHVHGADVFKKPGPDPKWMEERTRLVREVHDALSASNLESARAWMERLEAHLGDGKGSDGEYGALLEALNRASKQEKEEARRKQEWEHRREDLIESVETAVDAGHADEARRNLDLLQKHVSPSDKKGTIWKWFGKSKGSDDRLLRLLSNEVERLEVANREQKAWEGERERLVHELESVLQSKRLQEARARLESLSRHLGSRVEQDREYRLLSRQLDGLELEEQQRKAEEERRQAEEKRKAEERRRKEEEEARKRREPEKVITNSIGMEFVYIPPGMFMMGSPESEPERSSDEVQHKVTLTIGYYLQTTQVTQGQWQAVMGDNPSHFKKRDTCPVESISCDDCRAFIKKLNAKEGVDCYRLPTEAEWEYACRAGTTTPFAFGKCLSTDQANYDGNYPLSRVSQRRLPAEHRFLWPPFRPNAWGFVRHAWKRLRMVSGLVRRVSNWFGDGSDRSFIGLVPGASRRLLVLLCEGAARSAHRALLLAGLPLLLPGPPRPEVLPLIPFTL